MGVRINQYVDKFIFELDEQDKSLLMVKLCLGLTGIYCFFLTGIYFLNPINMHELVNLDVFEYYLMFWVSFFVLFGAMFLVVKAVGKERLPGFFPTVSAYMTGALFLGLFHWVGSLSSVIICLIPATLALGVPFFGKRAFGIAVAAHVSVIVLWGLEFTGVLQYAPLGINTHYSKILMPGNILAAIFWVGVTSFAIYIFSSRVYARLDEVQQDLKKQYELVQREQSKNEALLANILPHKVIEDLKNYGKTKPEIFSDVSVFFSDIVGFTSISSELDPAELIEELSEMFSEFDEIMERHGCERIKTIGDAYMAVAGLDEHAPSKNAERLVRASQEILSHLKARATTGGIAWRIRVGIHSGDIVGGIVGNKKYIYDVFGDTVNTASRMESNSEVMRINISEKTRDLLGETISVEDRGAFQIKGKGSMKMFFVAS